MILYFLEYSDYTGFWKTDAVCTTIQNAVNMLHRWYDSEVELYGKSLEIKSGISINAIAPEGSMAQIVYEKQNQWKEMRITCRESDEWIWLRPGPKAIKVEESYYFE